MHNCSTAPVSLLCWDAAVAATAAAGRAAFLSLLFPAVRARAVGDFVQEVHGQPKFPAVVHHPEGGGSGAIKVRSHYE